MPKEDPPKISGWYDVAIKWKNGSDVYYTLGLALFRDGKLADAPARYGNVIAWREPLRMIDRRGIGDDEALMLLGERLADDIQRQFCEAYRALLKAKTSMRYRNEIHRYLTMNEYMDSDIVAALCFNLTSRGEIIKTLCHKELKAIGVKTPAITRRRVHEVLRRYKTRYSYAIKLRSQEAVEKVERSAWEQIKSAIEDGRA